MKVTAPVPLAKLKLSRLSQRWSRGTNDLSSNQTNWLPDTIRPLIVLPGIIGTWPPAPGPRGRLDPINGTYHNLLAGLEQLGYIPGVSLFGFAYDWRRPVADTSRALGAEIKRIRALANSTKGKAGQSSVAVDYSRVDLLCHSMGGLVARSYIQSEYYGDDVANLRLIVAPQAGSAAAYFGYEGGDSSYIGIPPSAAQGMVAFVQAYEMRLPARVRRISQAVRGRNLPDLHRYMQHELYSIRDLLPLTNQQYLYRQNGQGQAEFYPFGHPRNELLERLNSPAWQARLDQLDQIHCFYSSSIPTITRLQVSEPGPAPLYHHGQPLAEQPAENRQPGDGVVAAFSAKLTLPELKPDGQPWQVKVEHTDLSEVTGQSLDHVQIAADPAPVRAILNHFTRPDAPALEAAFWDGPTLAQRKPNYRALFI